MKARELRRLRWYLRPRSKLIDLPQALDRLLNQLVIQHKWNIQMDKKMHQISKRIQTAEGDIRAGKKAAALKVLKKAEKKNEKLVKIDRDVRDPMIDKYKKLKKKGC